MFKKVHLRLTLLCAGITSFILIIMSLAYLYVSEEGLRRNNFISFQGNMDIMIINVKQLTILSHELLSKLEGDNDYYIYVLDNDRPFLFNSRHNDPARDSLFREARQYFEENFYSSMEPDISSMHNNSSLHTEFVYYSETNRVNCEVSAMFIKKEAGILQIFVLSPTSQLDAQIKAQEALFLKIDLAAFVLLFVFSWIFTRILLRPIEESQKQQTQFIAAASHELRTPLSVILSCASACNYASFEETKGFISTIQLEGARMSVLIEDLLMLGKADTQTISCHMDFVELDTLLLNSYETFEAMAKEKNLSLSISLPEAVCPLCFCDGFRISQVIAILLHNAIAYTPGQGCIALSLTWQNEQIRLAVTDNGPGVPDEEKEKIFKRFYRAEKARSTKGHSGLGLSIAYEIIQAHSGTILVTDTIGGGSTFTVRLPLS